MATFNYTHVVRYFGNGDGASFGTITVSSGTLDDGDADTTFEADDTVTGLFFDVGYIGTVVIDGETWPAFFDMFFLETQVYMSQAPVSPPATLQVDETAIFCFVAGTQIDTPTGGVAIERLAIGDLVTTADGRAVPVKWLGRQTLAPLFKPLRLIRVAAGALSNGLPLRDLTMTADHALMIDGLLVNAGALVNGTTITVVTDLPERVTIYHVETEAHDVILAEGTPAETYIDYAWRQAFDNYAEYVALYGEDRAIAENPAPRITSARQLPVEVQARLGIVRAA
ncbi:Hint domain-containing protein [Roseicyclus mahoneyensis]|uniref:Hint domain-containing protein n=1 Tax=Roseicyclus mahoneyensis TaxID=164332 RepID=A0A316GHM0_9RHOB|nr:Hint domain-containing protein [Roseicyclus mahoneyensis]PWK60451.1 Hint domain-containing protein [Roseicyclus mahoneyensis]